MNKLKTTLTLAASLSLAVAGLGTAAIATQTTSRGPSSVKSAAPPSNTQGPTLIAAYCAKVITQSGPLTVRSGPGIKNQAIGSVAKGETVRVERRNNAPMSSEAWHWLEISSPVKGWVSSKYIGAGFACTGGGRS